jgi:mRNA interferase MazF
VLVSERQPLRGEIWFVQLPVDPPGKGRRPVVIVSLDARNRHERADTVLVVPLTTSIHKGAPTHVLLPAGETGLQSDSAARAEDVTVVRKQSLIAPQGRLRQLSDRRVCELASKVNLAMGCPVSA